MCAIELNFSSVRVSSFDIAVVCVYVFKYGFRNKGTTMIVLLFISVDEVVFVELMETRCH